MFIVDMVQWMKNEGMSLKLNVIVQPVSTVNLSTAGHIITVKLSTANISKEYLYQLVTVKLLI